LLAAGFLVKPQPVMLVPLIAWVTYRRYGRLALLRAILAGAAVLVAGLAFFALHGELRTVIHIYRRLFESGEQISVSAWNGWWVVYRYRAHTYPQDVLLALGPLVLTIQRVSQLALLGIVVLMTGCLGRIPRDVDVLLVAALLAFSFFMLPMKMHERYLFPLFAFLAPAVIFDRRARPLYAALSVIFVLNLYALFPFPPVPRPTSSVHFIDAPADVIFSAVNVLLFAVFIATMAWDRLSHVGFGQRLLRRRVDRTADSSLLPEERSVH
jgi:hypothetical protein